MAAKRTKLDELRAFAEQRGAVPKSQYHPEPELAAKLLGGVEELGQTVEWDEGDLERKQQLARGLAEVYGGLRPAVGLASVCPTRRDTPGGGKPQKCGAKQPQQTVPHVVVAYMRESSAIVGFTRRTTYGHVPTCTDMYGRNCAARIGVAILG